VRVLVAGGAGFIGSHVCQELLRRGHDVTCLDNLSTGSPRNLVDFEDHPRFRFVAGDVEQCPQLEVDVILHLASPASPVDYDRLPLQTMAANSIGTWRLCDVARSVGARLTFVSTSEVYGDPLVHPQPESYWGNVDPIGPRACYDESKRFGEALVMSMRREHGLRANVVRLFNTYGPRMRRDDGRAIPELVSAALDGRPLPVYGDGRQTRSFCYVDDLVRGLLAVALDDAIDGEVFNIGNPTETPIGDLAERVRALIDPRLELAFVAARPGDPARRRPDISRMIQRYGWQPTIDLDTGLRATIDAFAAEAVGAA
jgi:nucleoside-diphosphate-sugar epimerase